MTEQELSQKVATGEAKVEEPQAAASPSPATNNSPYDVLLQFIPFLFDLRDKGATGSANGRSHGTGVTSIAGGFSPTKVTLNANDWANGITWDSANHRFVCATAGVYSVKASVAYSSVTSGKQYEAMVYVNGSQVLQGREAPGASSAYVTPHCADDIELAVGDYVELYTQHGDTGSNTIASAADSTFLSLKL